MESMNMEKSNVKMIFDNQDGNSMLCFAPMRDWLQFMEHSGYLYFAIAEASGTERAVKVVQKIINVVKEENLLADRAEELMAKVSGGHHNLEIKGKPPMCLKEVKRMLVTVVSGERPADEEVKIVIKKLLRHVPAGYNGPRNSDSRLRWKKWYNPQEPEDNAHAKETRSRIQSESSAGSDQRAADDSRNSV